MRILYFDVVCGASGDMLLSSLIGLGFPLSVLVETLRRLPIEPIEIETEKVTRGGVCCVRLIPKFGNSREYRHLDDILALLENDSIRPSIFEKCKKVFERLADAEARVHGIPRERVHFHEIGALDTIIDIMGFCMAIEYLKIDRIFFSTLTDGYGTVEVAHGVLPVPVPATAAMVEGYRVKTLPIPTELLTPTGAAILTALGEQRPDIWEGTIVGTGYGCGTKVFEAYPNFLRTILIEDGLESRYAAEQTVLLIESDMDHISGEIMGDVAGVLLEAGALDVSWLPLYMKKGRPAYRLSVMAHEADLEKMADLIIRHSRTLGVRFQRIRRITAERHASKTLIDGTECDEKKCSHKGYAFAKPEYEALAALARRKGCSILDLLDEYMRTRE